MAPSRPSIAKEELISAAAAANHRKSYHEVHVDPLDTTPPPPTDPQCTTGCPGLNLMAQTLGELSVTANLAVGKAEEASRQATLAAAKANEVATKLDELAGTVGTLAKDVRTALASTASTQKDVSELARKDRRKFMAYGGGVGALIAAIEAVRMVYSMQPAPQQVYYPPQYQQVAPQQQHQQPQLPQNPQQYPPR